QAKFVNIGKIDTTATFAAEVYRDGQLIDAMQSEKLAVAPGEEILIPAYTSARLDQSGSYRVTGYVTYDGKRTEAKDLAFSLNPPVPGPAQNLEASGYSFLERNGFRVVTIVLIAGLVGLIVIVTTIQRSHAGARPRVKQRGR
ncbi:MAG: hypothetical protein Q7O66_17280, partial [Dehalococcoidia bacterium]|nr:hypothetical protein [Dehalococcoidia bacterium]